MLKGKHYKEPDKNETLLNLTLTVTVLEIIKVISEILSDWIK